MQLPLQVTYQDMDPSEALDQNVRQHAEKLEQFYDQIMSCRVVVEAGHKHHHQGNIYHVRIDLKVPGKELVVSRDPSQHQAHEDVYVAIRDAFVAMRRQLEDFARRQRGKEKTHEVPLHGHISELVPQENFGRIETSDGRDIYFHRNSLINQEFDQLEVGAEVRFAEEMGENGPQASSVSVAGKHHVVG